MEEANKKTLQNYRMEEESHNRINNFILWGLFFTSQSAVGRLRTLELASIGVTPEQSGVLQLLAGNKGKSSIAEMAEAWLRQKNSVSTLIDRMSKQGLVEKIKIPKQKDLEIEITRKGRDLYYKISNTSKVFDMAFADLSREDKKRFAHYLGLVLARSRKILDEKDPR